MVWWRKKRISTAEMGWGEVLCVSVCAAHGPPFPALSVPVARCCRAAVVFSPSHALRIFSPFVRVVCALFRFHLLFCLSLAFSRCSGTLRTPRLPSLGSLLHRDASPFCVVFGLLRATMRFFIARFTSYPFSAPHTPSLWCCGALSACAFPSHFKDLPATVRLLFFPMWQRGFVRQPARSATGLR